MKTYALLFSIYVYERADLEKMSAQEKYELACVAAAFGYEEADVLTLDAFEEKVNNERITLDSCWLYFVTV